MAFLKKKKFRIAFIIVLVLAFVLVVGGVVATHYLIASELSKIAENSWNNYKNGKENFNGGFAMRVLSPKGNYFVSTGIDNASLSTHFRTASVSKTFTSAAIMLLNQRGQLNIDDKITANIPGKDIAYVPNDENFAVPYKDQITIKMLLMHRAGIFDVSNDAIPLNDYSYDEPYVEKSYIQYIESTNPNHTFTFDELVGVDAKNKLSFFKPGTEYKYSNTGYSMLGKIIERVSGKSYAEFITSELLKPNGLNDTIVMYNGSEQDLPQPYAKGYEWANGEIEDVTKSNMSPHVAEGSIITTPRDLASWAEKLFNGKAGLTKQSVELMMDSCSSTGSGATTAGKYGLGIMCTDKGYYGHNGAHAGYLSYMMYNPKTQVGYVTFTNSWDCQTCATSLDSLKTQLFTMEDMAKEVLQKLGY